MPADLNRLIAAAALSDSFCGLLLTNVHHAVAYGYEGYHFNTLDPYVLNRIADIKAESLQDFAIQALTFFEPASLPMVRHAA